MHPNEMIFGVDMMFSKIGILWVMRLDRAKPWRKKEDTKKRTVIKDDKYINTRNDVTMKLICFVHKLIHEWSKFTKDVEIQDIILNKAHQFALSNEHLGKDWVIQVKHDGRLYGRTYIHEYKDDIVK